MIILEAKIKFLTKKEGGLSRDTVSGIKPSFSVSNDLITSTVYSISDSTFFELGESYDVLIELPYGEHFLDEIIPNYQFTLNVASKVIATGKVISVID